jgi:hypothetical protein
MQVRIVDVDQDTGEETFRCVAPLDSIFEDDVDERQTAAEQLRRQGRYWVGGGAAPLVRLSIYKGEQP